MSSYTWCSVSFTCLRSHQAAKRRRFIMPIQQREASLSLASSVLFTLLLLLVCPLFSAIQSELILSLFVMFIISLWIVRKLSGLSFKQLDEMDKTIRLQSAIIAIHGFCATVVIYALALYLAYRNSGTVPIHQVLQLAFIGWLSLYFFWTASILVLYRRGALYV